jgi:nitrogen fixation-related uncharacterized protein
MIIQDIILLTKKILVGIIIFLIPLLIFYYGLKFVQYDLLPMGVNR